MAFERLEKLNEKHQCVIVKTNKQCWEQQKQMFQPATEMQRDEAAQAGDGQCEGVCFFSGDGLFSVNVMEIQASTKYIYVRVLNMIRGM